MKACKDGASPYDMKANMQKYLGEFHLECSLSPATLGLEVEDTEEGQEFYGTIIRKFEAQHQEAAGDSSSSDTSFEVWLVSEWDKAMAMARSEFKSCRASGQPFDKERYKTVLVDRCSFCGQMATAFKVLKACSRCKATYCDTECQKRAWPEHRKICKKK
jgi:hypothetical protein